MADRRKLDEVINDIKNRHNQELLYLRKKGADEDEIRNLNKLTKIQIQEARDSLGDDLMKLNDGHGIKLRNATLTTDFPDQSSMLDVATAKLKAGAKKVGKAALGAIPFAGTAYGLASGDPAMAAEEAAGDIPVLGQVYEAIKPSEIDRSSELMPTREQRGKNNQMMADNINEYLDSNDKEKYKMKKDILDKMRY